MRPLGCTPVAVFPRRAFPILRPETSVTAKLSPSKHLVQRTQASLKKCRACCTSETSAGTGCLTFLGCGLLLRPRNSTWSGIVRNLSCCQVWRAQCLHMQLTVIALYAEHFIRGTVAAGRSMPDDSRSCDSNSSNSSSCSLGRHASQLHAMFSALTGPLYLSSDSKLQAPVL